VAAPLYYRGNTLKVRDIFDIAVVDMLFPKMLRANLYRVTHLRSDILARLSGISEQFLRAELDELAISEGWRERAGGCVGRVRENRAGHPGAAHALLGKQTWCDQFAFTP
jgi:hypothetical protein